MIHEDLEKPYGLMTPERSTVYMSIPLFNIARGYATDTERMRKVLERRIPIMFSALAPEAFLNDISRAAGKQVARSPTDSLTRQVAKALPVSSKKLDIAARAKRLMHLAARTDAHEHKGLMEDVKLIVLIRNSLVHTLPLEMEPDGPPNPMVEGLVRRNVIPSPPVDPLRTWDDHVTRPEVAIWCHDVAARFVQCTIAGTQGSWIGDFLTQYGKYIRPITADVGAMPV
jgi:hypothetical protein